MTNRRIALWWTFTFSLLMVGSLLADIALPRPGKKPPKPPVKESPVPPGEGIDFDRARELFRKREGGQTLTADEEAYLRRAMAERQRTQPNGGPPGRDDRALLSRATTDLKPLCDMSADDRYLGEDGGLYGKGQNVPPEAHRLAAQAMLRQIRPLNSRGEADDNGRVVLVSISMSNATQEFSRFKQIADPDPQKSGKLTIVDCAQGGQAMAEWVAPNAAPWGEAMNRIERAGVTPAQVQVAWIKLANKGPRGDLQTHGRKLQKDTLAVIQNAKAKFPNLRIAYLSSRIYGGHSGGGLNPEPYAYESAFAARWLIQDQMQGNAELAYGSEKSPASSVKAPLLLWGPYLWADGTTPRQSDKLKWERSDLGPDGTHPSPAGQQKVAQLLLTFFKTDPLASSWFASSDTRQK